MIKTLVAYTGEIDDVQIAVEEVLSQLDLTNNQLRNSVGIIACHYEFVLSGVAKGVCDALSFDVVGTITSAQTTRDEGGPMLLTLMVLTSDEEKFVTGLTPSLLEDPGTKIAETYKEAAAAEAKSPALIMAFAPFMVQNSGDDYVKVFTEVSGGVPCFGTLAIDDTPDFRNCFMVSNGEEFRDRLSMILIYGDLKPKFFIANISEGKILDKEALITKSEGHILIGVNDRPVIEFFDDLGLKKASETSYAMSSLPFLLNYEDGTPPVSKIFIGLTPDESAICAGAMPEGATLHIGVTDKNDVILTTGEAMGEALSDISGASGMLMYSCIARYMALGSDLMDEMNLVREKIGDDLPFMMAYSGGEICPTQIADGKATNRFHNNAFVACVF